MVAAAGRMMRLRIYRPRNPGPIYEIIIKTQVSLGRQVDSFDIGRSLVHRAPALGRQ